MHTHPSPVQTDFTTPEGLRALIVDLTEREAWATSPVAAQLMVYATQKYAPIAKAWHLDPADAAVEAFIAMRTSSTVKADDPWAVVTRAVARSIPALAMADRHLISQDAGRRPERRPIAEPVRAGHYEEFFYDVHPHATPLYGSAPSREEDGVDRVIRTSSVFLVLTGWDARPVEQAVDYIAYRVTGLSSHGSAIDVVSAELTVASRLGYTVQQWRHLVRLVMGTKSKRKETRFGLFARALLGDTVADLLGDDELVALSRRAVRVPDERDPDGGDKDA